MLVSLAVEDQLLVLELQEKIQAVHVPIKSAILCNYTEPL